MHSKFKNADNGDEKTFSFNFLVPFGVYVCAFFLAPFHFCYGFLFFFSFGCASQYLMRLFSCVFLQHLKNFWQQLLADKAFFSACGMCRIDRQLLTSVKFFSYYKMLLSALYSTHPIRSLYARLYWALGVQCNRLILLSPISTTTFHTQYSRLCAFGSLFFFVASPSRAHFWLRFDV